MYAHALTVSNDQFNGLNLYWTKCIFMERRERGEKVGLVYDRMENEGQEKRGIVLVAHVSNMLDKASYLTKL